jgi:hypothetical protein
VAWYFNRYHAIFRFKSVFPEYGYQKLKDKNMSGFQFGNTPTGQIPGWKTYHGYQAGDYFAYLGITYLVREDHVSKGRFDLTKGYYVDISLLPSSGSGTTTPVVDSLGSTSTTSALSANQGTVLQSQINLLSPTPVVDNLVSTGTTVALSANQGRALKALIDAIPAAPAINNTVTSTSLTSPLSANMGKFLNDKIDALVIPTATVVNDTLVSTSATQALSANQGKVLKDLITALPTPAPIADNLTTNVATSVLSANQGFVIDGLIKARAKPINIAATNPIITSDTAAGYVVGSGWLNSATGIFYVCTSATVGAATWVAASTPAPSNFVGATALVAGTSGLVLAPLAGQESNYLRGDGTWSAIAGATPAMTGATALVAGVSGVVPTPLAGDQIKYLKGDGTWSVVPAMTGATALLAGTSGLVPVPAIGQQNYTLRGDGTWAAPASASWLTAVDTDTLLVNTKYLIPATGTLNFPAASLGDFVVLAPNTGTWETNTVVLQPDGTDAIGFGQTVTPTGTDSVTYVYQTGGVWRILVNEAPLVKKLSEKITQTAHGFSVKDVIGHNGTAWTKAKSTAVVTDVQAQSFVESVIDANTFTIVTHGVMVVTGHGLTVGEHYWLSQSTAGAITATTPVSGISQHVLYVRDVNTLFVDIDQPTTNATSSTVTYAYQALSVTSANNLTVLSANINLSMLVKLIVNGEVFTSVDPAPAFTYLNNVINWNPINGGMTLMPTDKVIVEYYTA